MRRAWPLGQRPLGFVIGRTGADDTIEGTLISGVQPMAVFRRAIATLLRQADGGKTPGPVWPGISPPGVDVLQGVT